MDNLYLASEGAGGRRLIIAPLSNAKLARCVERPSDLSGYFLTEEDEQTAFGEVKILAQVPDGESALRLASMFKMR